MVHQLQHEEGLVPAQRAHHHRRLERNPRWSMGSTVWRRSRKNHEARVPTGEPPSAALRKRSPSAWPIAVGPEVTVFVLVSQAVQGGGEGFAGAKAQTTGSGATSAAEELIRSWRS